MRQALVTGGAQGIGRAVAERLAAAGWVVTAIGRQAAGLVINMLALPVGQDHRGMPGTVKVARFAAALLATSGMTRQTIPFDAGGSLKMSKARRRDG